MKWLGVYQVYRVYLPDSRNRLMGHEGVPKSHHRQFRLLLRPPQITGFNNAPICIPMHL